MWAVGGRASNREIFRREVSAQKTAGSGAGGWDAAHERRRAGACTRPRAGAGRKLDRLAGDGATQTQTGPTCFGKVFRFNVKH